MAKTINMTLDPSSIDKALIELKDYEKWVKDKCHDLIEKMCREGESYAINAIGHIDTGATLSSIKGYRKGNDGFIVASGDVENGVCTAVWLEFGTGVYANGGGYPHPKAAELGMSAIGTYGKGHGANPNGWWYPSDKGYWTPKSGEYQGRKMAHTRGIKATMFMYNTAQFLKQYAPEFASEVFK